MVRKLVLRRSAAVSVSILVAFFLLTACCAPSTLLVTPDLSNQQRYDDAVRSAVFVNDGEIRPLVTLAPDDPLTTWNDKGQVLLLTFHHYPESYVAGKNYSTNYGEVWAFTDKEIAQWYQKNKSGVTDWTMRFKQVIGVPHDKEYTHFSAMWTNPEDVKRPAYETDVTKQITKAKLPADVAPEFQTWFEGNIIWSYFDSWYPWTRLGYTCDWAKPGKTYGVSEFLIRKDATVAVEFTKTVGEFVVWLNNREHE